MHGNADQMKIPAGLPGSICHAELIYLSILKHNSAQSSDSSTSPVLPREVVEALEPHFLD
jgi:hypothetical protein